MSQMMNANHKNVNFSVKDKKRVEFVSKIKIVREVFFVIQLGFVKNNDNLTKFVKMIINVIIIWCVICQNVCSIFLMKMELKPIMS